MLLLLACRSLWNRRYVAILTIISIAVSAALLLGVQQLRRSVHNGFAQTVAGADLLVGPRTGPINLLLYAIFHIGEPSNGISRKVYDDIAVKPAIAWTIPISLGDSHRGSPVVGTNTDYFRYYRYGDDRPLVLSVGRPFRRPHEVVLGAAVARRLGYHVDEWINLSHGSGGVSFADHDGLSFRISGILKPTGTPVDHVIHAHLDAIAALHSPLPRFASNTAQSAERSRSEADPHSPYAITAFLVGLKSPDRAFAAARSINAYTPEPLTAVMPAVALQMLWEAVGVAEQALTLISVVVVLTGLIGMMIAMLTSLNERRREMAIMRSVGAQPRQILYLLVSEALILAVIGSVLGMAITQAVFLLEGPRLTAETGIAIQPALPSIEDFQLIAMLIISAVMAGLVPAIRGYRATLADGLTIRG